MSEQELKGKILETLPKYLGHSNLLSQRDLDQGDTSQRVGALFTLLILIKDQDLIDRVMKIHPDYHTTINLLKAQYGLFRRSPNPDFWGHDPRNFSRDQASIIKQAVMLMGDIKTLFSFFVRQAIRLSFHQNYFDDGKYKIPDPIGPQELSVYARSFLGPLSYLVTIISDSLMILDLFFRNNNDLNKWSADNMLAQNLLVACHRWPTPMVKLAMYFYKKTDFMQRLWNYHANPANNGCEPLYYLFKLAYLKLENYS